MFIIYSSTIYRRHKPKIATVIFPKTIRMRTLTLICLLFVTGLFATNKSCSEMKAIRRTPASASGRWYLVAAKQQDMRDRTFKKSRTPECGDDELPCLCVGLDINSTMKEPFISEYNMTIFFYDVLSGKHKVQPYKMKLTNTKSEMEIFNTKQEGDLTHSLRTDNGETFVLRNLATNDYHSFMLLHVCNDHNQEMDIWFLSKTMIASEESTNEVKKALMANNLTMSQLAKVEQENCVYPTVFKTIQD